jgi:hypothetical protein
MQKDATCRQLLHIVTPGHIVANVQMMAPTLHKPSESAPNLQLQEISVLEAVQETYCG